MAERRVAPSEAAFENILAYLDAAGLKEGDRLPAERTLTDEWGISRTALRAALRELIARHVLESRGGSGTYVAMRRPESNCRGYNGYSDTVRAVGKTPSSKVLWAKSEVADAHVAHKLRLEEGDPIFDLRRVRLIDDLPCMIETVYINGAVCPGIEKYDFQERSLFDTLRQEYGITLPHGEERLSITRVDADEAEELGLAEGDPVYFQTGVSETEERTPVEYFKAAIRSARYTFYARQEHLSRGHEIPEKVIADE